MTLFSCQPVLDALQSEARRIVRSNRRGWLPTMSLERMNRLVQSIAEADGLQLYEPLVSTLLVNPAGVVSTSYSPEYDLRVGLHIDNHEDLPIPDRSSATPVCCVNVGEGSREFMFVPQTIGGLLPKVGVAPIADAVRTLPETLFAGYPDAPIVRVVIPPGYGYIATAQNLIHDGCAVLSGRRDMALLSLRRASICT